MNLKNFPFLIGNLVINVFSKFLYATKLYILSCGLIPLYRRRIFNEICKNANTVLDLGSGYGYFSNYMRRNGLKVNGIDKEITEGNILCDFLQYKTKVKYGAVLASLFLHELDKDDIENAILKIKSLLFPNGLFVIFDYYDKDDIFRRFRKAFFRRYEKHAFWFFKLDLDAKLKEYGFIKYGEFLSFNGMLKTRFYRMQNGL